MIDESWQLIPFCRNLVRGLVIPLITLAFTVSAPGPQGRSSRP